MDQKLQNAVEGLIDSVDKQHFRGIRKEAFLCSARCCDAPGSHEELQHCVNDCQSRMAAAENLLGAELEAFQGRLQRCAMACRDSVADKLGPSPTQAQVQTLQAQVDACTLKCVDDHIGSLAAMKRRMDEQLPKLR